MKLIEQLREEHVLIEQVLGSLMAFVQSRLAVLSGETTAEAANKTAQNGKAFIAFFRLYAGQYHHAREEDTLFVALHTHAELPIDRGPIAALTAQHHHLAGLLSQLEPLLFDSLVNGEKRLLINSLATQYCHQLWAHIDAENTVLLPEAEKRLSSAGVYELKGREPSQAELDAFALGKLLVEQFPPTYDPKAIRGEGCVICPSFGNGCDGVEREWWNEYEWEEFADKLG